MLTDDLPWPELGNVSRGATRGNQGSKGVLGPPDNEGRAILQLRVQPGVLAVKLNTKASEWYRILDTEVQNALKVTKTYWRKARRRQDYDARADQDHMELHEWLQQLKDKVMSHLELLMQKGEIQGPPYVMPEHLEFTFMRKFVERHENGTPHNPRLRDIPREEQHRIPPEDLTESDTADARTSNEASDPGPSWSRADKSPVATFSSVRTLGSASPMSPTWSKLSSTDPSASSVLSSGSNAGYRKVENSQVALRQARERLALAKAKSQEALAKYINFVEIERQAENDVKIEEEQMDEFVDQMIQQGGSPSST